MAKQDRRAIQDEAIQSVAPQEEIRVSDVPVENLEPIMNAEYQRAGLWLNPDLFRDLAIVSDTIHDTRRHSRNMEFNVGLNKMKLDHQEMIADATRATEFAQKKYVSDYMLQYRTDMDEALEQAKRSGKRGMEAVDSINIKYDKIQDRLSDQSYYMGELFRTFRQQETLSSAATATKNDVFVAENLAKRSFEEAAALGITNMVLGRYNFDDYLREMPKSLFPLLDTLTDPEEANLMNNNYNAGFLADIKRIVANVKNNVIPVATAEQYIVGALQKYQQYTFTGTDAEGKERQIKSYLLPATISSVLESLSTLKQSQNKANAVYTYESYMDMVGSKYAEKGEFDKISYYKNTTPAKAREDIMSARAQLIAEMGNGNESARKQLWELDHHYWTVVYPQITFRDLLRKSLATTGNVDSALRDIGSRLNSVEKKLINNEPLDNITDLSWTDGITYINLGYPASGTDPYFDDFMRRRGVPPDQAQYVYYQTIVEEGRKFLAQAKNSDLIAAMDPNYATAMKEVLNEMTYEHLVREDVNTGTIVPNLEGIQTFAESLKKSNLVKRAAAGTTIVGNQSAQILSQIVDTSNKLNTKQRAIFYRSLATGFSEAGMPDIFTSYKLSNLNEDQKKVAQQIAMWSYLDKSPALSGVANLILNNQIGGVEPDPTIASANTIIQGKTKNAKEANLYAEINRRMDEYNIPADFRSSLTHLFANMATASVAGDNKENRMAFDANLITQVLDANFTKNGTYKYSAALGGIDANQADQRITDAKNIAQTGLKNLGAKGQITARIDYDTGRVNFYSDGQPFMGTGTYAPLMGSGKVPFSIPITGKPAGMSEEEFSRAQATMIAGATMNVALANAQLNPKVQAILRENGVQAGDAEKWAYKYMSVLNDEGAQQDWYAFCNSNYSNTRIKAAPPEIKKVLLDTMKKIYSEGQLYKRFGDHTTENQMSQFVDFMYTRMQSGNTLRIDVPPSAHFESKGFPMYNINEQIQNAGWKVTSTTDGKHSGVGHRSGTATDVGLEGGFWQAFIPGSNLLNTNKLDKLVDGVLDPNAKNGNLRVVLTSHKYLIKGAVSESDPRYKKYAKYRNMKNSNGEPLFKYWSNHADHFHLEWNKVMYDTATGKPYNQGAVNYIRNIANVIDTNINDKGTYGFINRNESKAIATLFHNYKPTEWDAKNTGRSLTELNDSPVTQALAAAAKYQRGKNVLGSSNLAIKGMMGAKFKLMRGPGLSKSLKLPDGEYTMEEVIDLYSKGLRGSNEFKWVLSDTENDKRYKETVNRFVRAGR